MHLEVLHTLNMQHWQMHLCWFTCDVGFNNQSRILKHDGPVPKQLPVSLYRPSAFNTPCRTANQAAARIAASMAALNQAQARGCHGPRHAKTTIS